jgi:hypothetical protein
VNALIYNELIIKKAAFDLTKAAFLLIEIQRYRLIGFKAFYN